MKKNTIFFSFLTLLFCAFLASCGTETAESNINDPCLPAIDISKINNSEINVKIERVDNDIFALKTKEEISAYFKKNQLFTKKYIQLERFGGNDSIPVKEIYSLISNKYLDTLHQDCNRIYGDMKPLENELTNAFKHIKAIYPDFVPPRVQTMITGYGKGARLREMPEGTTQRTFQNADTTLTIRYEYSYRCSTRCTRPDTSITAARASVNRRTSPASE